MLQPNFFNAAVTLVLIVGCMIGLGYLSKRFGIAAVMRSHGATARGGGGKSLRIDRGRVLSIVELDGVRFAILIGGRTDQILFVPGPAGKDALS